MEHRHMSNQLMIPGHYQHENNHPPFVRGVATENGRFVTPTDYPISGGAHSNPGQHLGGIPNGYHSSNTNLQTHNLPPPFSRPPFDPYTHTSTNGNTSLVPVGPIGHIHPAHSISESRGPGKRKAPGVFEGSSSGFNGAGSSSGSQMFPYRGVNLSIDGPDSMRNVRRRLEPCMTSAHVPNYDSHYYQPTTHPANYSVPVQPINLSADVTGREWNTVPYAASYNRTSHPDIHDPRRETNQYYAGGSSVDVNASHYNPSLRGNIPSSSQNPHVSHVQPTRDAHSYHHQRVTPFYRNDPNYSNYNNGGSYSTNELRFPSENISSRYSSFTAAGEWGGGGYMGGRPRLAVERLQPLFGVIDSHHGFGHETVTVEESSLYQEPSNLPDEYQDMRLDIDDMSYEELLALEESIGYVNSGLSEDGISKCLREKIYYSMDQSYDTCPICLDEYENGEKIGRIEKCGHEYHVDCIKKWVTMKKVCPICKSEC
ncbi:putative transcription factor C2H2 family [Helianthus annuus]|nr:putative transcription factor C2H2 family [Helianthus annuus]